MGFRANIVTECVHKHDGSSVFNRKAKEVQDMLEKNGIDVRTRWLDLESAKWEISTSGTSGKMYQRFIAKLETLPPDEINEFFTEGGEYTNENVKEILEEWWRYRDKQDDVIRIDWF